MRTTKIWLLYDFEELSTKSKGVALENIRKEVQKEISELMSIDKKFLKEKAKDYGFLEGGTIVRRKGGKVR